MSFAQGNIRAKRETVITELGLTIKCVDDDGDGYSKYNTATGCANPGLDCDDYHPETYPGAPEICDDGQDNDCNGLIDCKDPACPACPKPCGAAMTIGQYPASVNYVASFLALPLVGFVVAWRLYRRKR
jgi:hypothetical protein